MHEVQTVTLVRPDTCEIAGTTLDENGAVSGIDVYAYGDDLTNFFTHYGYATSDENGNYSMSVVCNSEYVLYNFSPGNYSYLSFNVNNEVGGDELSDNGDLATISPIEFVNLAPFGYAYLNYYALAFEMLDVNGTSTAVYTLEQSEEVSLWAWAYDFEGDYPLTVVVDFKKLDGTLVDSATETYTIDDPSSGLDGDGPIFTAPSAGQYYLSGTVTDAKGKSRALNDEFSYTE